MVKNLTKIIFSIWLFSISLALANDYSARNGMVVSAHPMASQFGVEILKSGGNAVDAAVGAAVLIGFVEPHASGFGGGGGMLIYLHDADSLAYINYYQQAPKNFPADFDRRKESNSARAILVPGTVAGLHFALEHYGTFSWKEILLKAAAKLENGIPVDQFFHNIIFDSYEKLLQFPETQEIFLPGQLPPAVGDTLHNPAGVRTLKILALRGPDAFYQGEIGDSIVATVQRHGGVIEKSDLMNYRIRLKNPLRGTYRNYRIVTAPPPQSGATVLEILNILELKDLSNLGSYEKNVAAFHFMAEAMKRAYADRLSYLSDPKFVPVPTETLISKKFARNRFATINFFRATPANPKETKPGKIEFIKEKLKKGSTTHISVVDAAGNAVSLTQTINRFWGCGLSVCGFLLNNGMTSFSPMSRVNQAEPGKQPRSTISPTILFRDGNPAIVIGSPGSGTIISTIVEVICNLIDFQKSPIEANLAPRFCSRKWTTTLPVEGSFSKTLIDSLKKMGHPIEIMSPMDMYFGGVQLIVRDEKNKTWIGCSDPRRSGAALGY